MTYFTRLPTQEGSRRCFTLSIWMKRSRINKNFSSSTSLAIQGIFSGTSAGTTFMRFNDDANGDEMRWYTPDGSTYHRPARRDPCNWTHYMWVVDTGIEDDNNAADRFKLYVNGVEVQDVRSQGYANRNTQLNIFSNSTGPMSINSTNESGQKGNHYMCDFFLIDGKALTPDVFGYFKDGLGYYSVGHAQDNAPSGAFQHTTGVWQPKAPRMIIAEINRRGGFGGNGCYLPMNTACNAGFDFRIFNPDTILKLKHDTPQPKNIVDGDPKQAVREDPLKDFLILALPFDVNGLDQGRGDYSALIRGSGTAKSLTGTAVVTTTGHSVYGSMVNGREEGSSANFDGSIYYTLGNDSDFFLTNEDFTIECWVRQHSFNTAAFFSLYDNTGGASARTFWFGTDSSGRFQFYFYHGNNTTYAGDNTLNMRTGQWYHLVAERYDGKIQMFIDGKPAGACYNIGNTALNSPANVPTYIGGNYKSGSGNNYYFDGRLKDLRVYKGVAKYKLEGFQVPHLFQTHEYGYWDTTIDAPKTNFATYNHLDRSDSGGEHEEGGLRHDRNNASAASMGLTHMVSSGKWYLEVRLDETPASNAYLGIMSDTASGLNFFSEYARYVLWQYNQGKLYYNNSVGGGSISNPSYGTTPSSGDIIAMAFDADSRQIRFFVNGVEEPSVPTLMPDLGETSVYHGSHYQFWLNSNGADQVTINTGQNPTFLGQETLSTTYSDASGRGKFYYPVPDGYNAICSANLPAPIKDPGKYFRTIVYMGSEGSSTGPTRQVTGTKFRPDVVWIKPINQGDNNLLFDSVRGPDSYLYINGDHAAGTDNNSNYGRFMSFDKNGFTIGPWNNLNNSGEGYVAMCWKAGGRPTSALPYMVDDVGYATLEAAGIDSPLDSNTITPIKMSVGKKQGFSVVHYHGNGGSSQSVPHGLGKKPVVALLKNMDSTVNFDMHMFESYRAALNTAEADQGNGNTLFTEDTFILANSSAARNATNVKYIAYIWAEIEGYSKFGFYRGNGSANGTFVYTGFKPAWIMTKQVDGSNSWSYQDTTRSPDNPMGSGVLRADSSSGRTGIKECDMLSNGFKWRVATGYGNDSNTEYLYMAFASSPFAHNLAD